MEDEMKRRNEEYVANKMKEIEEARIQEEILNNVRLSREEIANEAVDAYTLELMEAGVL